MGDVTELHKHAIHETSLTPGVLHIRYYYSSRFVFVMLLGEQEAARGFEMSERIFLLPRKVLQQTSVSSVRLWTTDAQGLVLMVSFSLLHHRLLFLEHRLTNLQKSHLTGGFPDF